MNDNLSKALAPQIDQTGKAPETEEKVQESPAEEPIQGSSDEEPISESPELNPDWAHDALQDLEDWIESQGIYIRQ